MYFKDICARETATECKDIIILVSGFESGIIKLYFCFLSNILAVINKLNVEFQSEKVKIHKVHAKISDLYRGVLRNFMNKKYLDTTPLEKINWYNPDNFLPEKEMYLGAKFEQEAASFGLLPRKMSEIKTNCLKFYVTLAKNIRTRFEFGNGILKFMNNFEPSVALSGRIPSVLPIMNVVAPLKLDIDLVNSDWRHLADVEELKPLQSLKIEEFWYQIGGLKDEDGQIMFNNISKVVNSLLCLPQSSANVERIFSQHNNIKTELRNRLGIDTSNALLHAKDMLKCFDEGQPICCFDFKPSDAMINAKLTYIK